MNIPKVIDIVLKNDLCIGCGLCVYKCPSNALQMNWNEYGFLVPELANKCDQTGECISVCPFNPIPEKEVETENELADIFLNTSEKFHPKIGKYVGIYAGYSNEFRLTSSSGGIATYIFSEILKQGIVAHIFSVKESNESGIHYEYAISSSQEELLMASKTKYYPVTLGTVMPKIHELDGKVAIVGVACFIKAIRLAQYKEPELKEKIPFLVGIICGGVKSRFFTEYLASKTGVQVTNIEKPQFRIKDLKSTAGNYSFGCIDKTDKSAHTIKMRLVGDMWGSGMFKANVCDYCDDVTTELADISLGDAWLPPFNKDGAGTNVIVTRSMIAEKLIQKGIQNKKLSIEILLQEQFLASQQGSFNHRHTGLSYRIKQSQKKNQAVPPKRFENGRIPIDFKIVQILRSLVRQKSLIIWKDKSNFNVFNKKILPYTFFLKMFTKFYHLSKRIKKI
jgi:coenzyme F420 hydrogenase subunit beta